MLTFPGKKILAVDDGLENLLLLEMFLQETEIELTLAHNGQEAFELCQKNRYDLILMDVLMPLLNGYDATSRIRQLGQNMPIVAITAHGGNIEHDKCLQAGCNGVLVKPINKTNFMQTLQLYLK